MSGNDDGVFEIVQDREKYNDEPETEYRRNMTGFVVKVKDPTKIDLTKPEYQLRIRAEYQTKRMTAGLWQTTEEFTVTIPVNLGPTNNVPKFKTEAVENLSLKKEVFLPEKFIGDTTLQQRTNRLDQLVETALDLPSIYDSTNQFSGYIIEAERLRNTQTNTSTQFIQSNMAGVSGMAVAWNIDARRNADGTYDFSNVRVRVVGWAAAFDKGAKETVHYTDVANNDITVDGPPTTISHELMHVLGSGDLIGNINAKIRGLTGAGGTAGHLGAAWAWWMVSYNWAGLHPTGSKSDPADAQLLTKFLMHHRDSLRTLQPDTPETRKLNLVRRVC